MPVFRSFRSRRPGGAARWLIALICLAGAAAGAAWWFWPRPDQRATMEAEAPPLPTDPRLSATIPWKNVHPSVKYVGDAACADCHAEIVERYKKHGMGRSLAPMSAIDETPVLKKEFEHPFDADGFHYYVERKGDATIHHEVKKDGKGGVLFDYAVPVSFAVGSGERGKSYFIERNGRLYQSPISWFNHERRWDLSPGFAGHSAHFERPMTKDCLFCHANLVEHEAGTVNQYKPPLFRGYAIGCERCHGPGELHVKWRSAGEKKSDVDQTIVNPARLAPALREAVCEQCHLQGEARVARLGRDIFEFRPGMPLEDFSTVFVRAPEHRDEKHSVGQVEQIRLSRCYVASEGKLGCISCHDPHGMPSAQEKPKFYRGKCQACHAVGKSDCKQPLAERQPGNDCISCHMPRHDSSNIIHTSITDHRIPRRAGEKAERKAPLGTSRYPIVAFQKRSDGAGDDPRDLGIALATMAMRAKVRATAEDAMPMLQDAVKKQPRDVEAHMWIGQIWLSYERFGKARTAFENAMKYYPDHEDALFNAARMAATDGAKEALPLYKRLVARNPFVSEYHLHLGLMHKELGDTSKAIKAYEEAIRLNPARIEPRRELILALTKSGDLERAAREFAIYEALGPPDVQNLRKLLK